VSFFKLATVRIKQAIDQALDYGWCTWLVTSSIRWAIEN